MLAIYRLEPFQLLFSVLLLLCLSRPGSSVALWSLLPQAALVFSAQSILWMVKIKGVPPGTDEQGQARQRGSLLLNTRGQQTRERSQGPA